MLLDTKIDKLGGIGSSEIGKLYTRDGLKAKTAQTCAFEKAVELIVGYKKNITTIAMQHGIFNEEEAYNDVVLPNFPTSKYQSSESILISDGFWTTPDVIDEVERVVIDLKCPYSIATYYKNINKPPNTYISQIQGQLLGTGLDSGYICVYLTSNKIDKYGNKIEYDIDINKRHCFVPVNKDEDMISDMKDRVSEFFTKRDIIFNHLTAASEISDIEFFNIHETHKVTRFQDKSNLFNWEGMIVNNAGIYYVIEKKR